MNNLFLNYRDFIRDLRLCGFILVPGKERGVISSSDYPENGGITASRKKKNVCKKSVSDARKFVRLHY